MCLVRSLSGYGDMMLKKRVNPVVLNKTYDHPIDHDVRVIFYGLNLERFNEEENV